MTGLGPLLTATALLACLASAARAQTTLFSENYTGGATSLTYANMTGITAHGAASDATLGESYQVQAGNLSVFLVLFPTVSLGASTGDYLRLNVTLRTESNPSGYFRLGLFDDGGTLWSSANGDDTGYNTDFGNVRSAWYATGGPAYYLTTGSPVTTTPGTTLQRTITTTAPVTLQFQLTRTESGATFTVHRGTSSSGPTTLVYSLDHASPVTTFDEFSIFTQSARNYWIDDLALVTGNLSTIPEPSTYAAGCGLAAFALVARRRRRKV